MDKGIREAACSVRPYLGSMLGQGRATRVDAELAQLLNAGVQDADHLRAVLEQHEATSDFLERVLDDAPLFRPPQAISVIVRGYGGLPGHGSPVGSDKYVCPRGDYVWYRVEVGAEIGRCPSHPDCQLEPESLG